MRKFLIYTIVIVCTSISISAQKLNQSRLSGLVKDQNKAVIVGARVFLLNLQTRMEKVAVTDSGGVFTFE